MMLEPDCVDPWSRPLEGSDCYTKSTNGLTYEQAVAYCSSIGGFLAEPRSQSDTTAILLLDFMSTGYFWIGLSDLKNEGEFRWESNTDAPSYSNWRSGEPNNFKGNEDCVAWCDCVGKRGWNDIMCGDKNFALCQKL